MHPFDQTLMQKLKRLCRIHTTEEESERLLHDLLQIVVYVEQLQQLDTQDCPPCDHVLQDVSNVMREDEVSTHLPREKYLLNAPDQIGGMIRIPTWLKQETEK